MRRAKSVDDYIQTAELWPAELTRLCTILRATPLVEDIKWGAPCYTYKGKNVVGIGGFKKYFGLWFHQGALLKDDAKVLVNAQEGVTKALRQWRMTTANDIKPAIIKRYVNEAIAHIESGNEISAVRGNSVTVPDILASAMRRQKGVTAAFRNLRKGLQREYAEYIDTAKRDDTKRKRIEKILPMIAAGIGLNDKYRR